MPFTITINRKTLFLLFLYIALITAFLLEGFAFAEDARFKIRNTYLEAKRTSYPIPISLEEGKGEVLLVDEYKFENLPENEFLGKWSALEKSFRKVSLDIEASEPVFERENFQKNRAKERVLSLFGYEVKPNYSLKKKVDKTKSLETNLNLENIKVKTYYHLQSDGIKRKALKQTLSFKNTYDKDLTLSILLKHEISTGEIMWGGERIILEETPRELSAPDKVSFLVEEEKTFYNFSDIPDKFSPKLWVVEEEGENLLILSLLVDVPSRGETVIDPVYNFVDVTQSTDDYYAYEKWGPSSFTDPSDTGNNEASNTDYEYIASSDNTHWETAGAASSTELDSQLYKFTISEDENNITQLSFLWEGYGNESSGVTTTLSAWSYDSSTWVQLDTGDNTTTDDFSLTFIEASNPGQFVSSSSEVTIMAETEYGAGWSSPSGITSNSVNDTNPSLSCPSSDWCMLTWTGYNTGLSSNEVDFSTWDGSSWDSPSTLEAYSGGANSATVSCTSSSYCMAVWVLEESQDQELRYSEWDGSSWSVNTDITSNEYNDKEPSVSCTSSSFCMLAWTYQTDGTSSGEEIYWSDWDGSSWSAGSGLTSDSLETDDPSISCTSSSFCMLAWRSWETEPVLHDEVHYSEWNGSSWTSSAPNWNYGNPSVSCTSSSFCMLTVQSGSEASVIDISYSEWDGSSWTSPSNITSRDNWDRNSSVSCTSSSFCMLAWSYQTDGTLLGEEIYYSEWDGSSWDALSAITSNSYYETAPSISCPSSSYCMLVWNYDEGGDDPEIYYSEWE